MGFRGTQQVSVKLLSSIVKNQNQGFIWGNKKKKFQKFNCLINVIHTKTWTFVNFHLVRICPRMSPERPKLELSFDIFVQLHNFTRKKNPDKILFFLKTAIIFSMCKYSTDTQTLIRQLISKNLQKNLVKSMDVKLFCLHFSLVSKIKITIR